ncbi:MAG TPA: hypothetical protein VG122_21525 [Gemmata sp.]|jgi:hypothetical protein|nr:hypothetical protein [Gemmata sp.]
MAVDVIRAEFARVQCAAAQLPEKDSERERLNRKAGAMFHAYGWWWYGRATQPAGWKAGWQDLFCQFNRGFLTTLRIPARLVHLIADLPTIFTMEPIGTIAFEGVGVRADHLRALRRLAVSPRQVRLTFHRSSLQGDPVGYLTTALDSPLATAAVAVDASGYMAGPVVAHILARSPFVTNLRELILDANRLDGSVTASLANNPRLRQLQLLSVKGNLLGSAGFELLSSQFGDRLIT